MTAMSRLDCGSQGCEFADHSKPGMRMASCGCYCKPDQIKEFYDAKISELEAKLKTATEALGKCWGKFAGMESATVSFGMPSKEELLRQCYQGMAIVEPVLNEIKETK